MIDHTPTLEQWAGIERHPRIVVDTMDVWTEAMIGYYLERRIPFTVVINAE